MKLRLRDIREDQDKSQSVVARWLNCSQQTYSRYENGVTEPTLATLVRLAEYYGTSVDYLLGVTDEQTPYPRSNEPTNTGTP